MPQTRIAPKVSPPGTCVGGQKSEVREKWSPIPPGANRGLTRRYSHGFDPPAQSCRAARPAARALPSAAAPIGARVSGSSLPRGGRGQQVSRRHTPIHTHRHTHTHTADPFLTHIWTLFVRRCNLPSGKACPFQFLTSISPPALNLSC